jgi:hypothetical protein
MPSITGFFSGTIMNQASLTLTNQQNHNLGIAEVSGTQNSPDSQWNNSSITYWGVTVLLDGKGTPKREALRFISQAGLIDL